MIKCHANEKLYLLNVDDGEKHRMRLGINVPTAKSQQANGTLAKYFKTSYRNPYNGKDMVGKVTMGKFGPTAGKYPTKEEATKAALATADKLWKDFKLKFPFLCPIDVWKRKVDASSGGGKFWERLHAYKQ